MRQFIVEGEPGIFPPGVLWLWRKIGFGRPKRRSEPERETPTPEREPEGEKPKD